MRALNPNVLIFSVFQKSVSAAKNEHAHAEMLSILQGAKLPVIELQGRYAGQDEKSILIQGFEHRATVERICQSFNQECYLESHNDRATFLVYPNGESTHIGTMKAVSQDEAEQYGAFSYNPIARQHFICK